MMKKLTIAMFAVFLTTACGFNLQTGSGEKIGQIVRLEYTGVVCDSWEAQMIRGGLTSGSGTMGAPFHFTLSNEAQVQAVKAALQNQTEVLVKYVAPRQYGVCSSDTGVFMTAIEPAPTSK